MHRTTVWASLPWDGNHDDDDDDIYTSEKHRLVMVIEVTAGGAASAAWWEVMEPTPLVVEPAPAYKLVISFIPAAQWDWSWSFWFWKRSSHCIQMSTLILILSFKFVG